MNATIARPVADSAAPRSTRGLPAWVYNHPEMTRLELERILKPSWQIACHISQIPGAGDYVTFELGSDSVIVLRERGGVIRALRNVCRHRGTRLLEGAGRCHGRITCPYHGWTYRYDGSLLATPAKESFPSLNLREHGLDPVHVEQALGFVFVCLAAAGSAATLTDVGADHRRAGALSVRGARAHANRLFRGVGCRLEDRDGQLSGVLSRADRPSGTEPHVHARLRGPARGPRYRARHQLDARGALVALERARLSEVRRPGDRAASARAAAAQLAFLQLPAQSRHRHHARAGRLLSGPAPRAGQDGDPRGRLRTARRATRDAPAALARQPHQHGRSTRKTGCCASGCSAASPTAATGPGRCRRSRAG